VTHAAGTRGFVAAACSLVAVFAASASPIPLYEIYRRGDALTHADLALTAVAYFVAVMAAMLVLGRLSNHIGRRPVALAALGVTAWAVWSSRRCTESRR
jgi:MFS family permease